MQGGSSDAAHCVHRSVFETRSYFSDGGAPSNLCGSWTSRGERQACGSRCPRSAARRRGQQLHSGRQRRIASATSGRGARHAVDGRDDAVRARSRAGSPRTALSGVAAELCRARVAPLRRPPWRRQVPRSAARAGTAGPKLAATLALGLLGPGVLARSKAAAAAGARAGPRGRRGGATILDGRGRHAAPLRPGSDCAPVRSGRRQRAGGGATPESFATPFCNSRLNSSGWCSPER